MYPAAELKKELDTLFQKWVQSAENRHDEFLRDCKIADDYYDGKQIPAGYLESAKQQLELMNDPTVPPEKKTMHSYVIINQIVKSHDNIMGQLIRGHQSVEFKARSIRDHKKVFAVQKAMRFIEDQNQSWIAVAIPAIGHMLHRGLGWAKCYHDPFENIPYGKIVEEHVSARDVLLDPNVRDEYLQDRKYIIHRIRYELEDAREEFSDIVGFDSNSLANDSDWERGAEVPAERNFCTIYEIHYRKRINIYKKVDENQNVSIISKEEYDALNADENLRMTVFRQRQYVHYVALYNKKVQTFYHAINPNGDPFAPCINRKSENSPYPIGDFTYYKNLQDLFNVLMTLVLDDASRGRKFLAGVDPQIWTNKIYRDEIDKAIQRGGSVPTTGLSMKQFPGVSEGVLILLNLVQRAIDDIRALPQVQRGELPAKQISTETVQTLIQSAMTSHGRKEVNINFFLTALARIRYRILVNMWTTQDWIRVTDHKPGEPEFIPINMVVDEEEYVNLLQQMSELPAPEDVKPEERQQVEIAFSKFRQKFEKQNDVVREERQFHQYGQDPALRTDEQFKADIESSGLEPEMFVVANDVKMVTKVFYIINMLDPNMDIDIKYKIDFDVQRTRERRQALSVSFADRQWQTPIDTMQDLDIPDAEARFQRATEFYPNLQLAVQLQKDPNFRAAVELANKILTDPRAGKAFKAFMDAVPSNGAESKPKEGAEQ